jgi:RNA polymerase sigma factor for flagellar operon FliA
MLAYDLDREEQRAQERERLILEHLPLVSMLARRIHERLPPNVSLDDLISVGTIGLISAVDSFDPKMGVKVKTYADYKIRGAILDSIRSLDWVSRKRRKKAKEIEAAILSAQQKVQRTPTKEEIAAELGLTLEQYHERLLQVQGLNLESLEQVPGPEGGTPLINMIPGSEESIPSRVVERAELERVLAEGIQEVPETERTVLSLFYKEGLTLREIAGVMDISISRVSHLKSQAVLRLRVHMQTRWPQTRGR